MVATHNCIILHYSISSRSGGKASPVPHAWNTDTCVNHALDTSHEPCLNRSACCSCARSLDRAALEQTFMPALLPIYNLPNLGEERSREELRTCDNGMKLPDGRILQKLA